MKIFHTLHEILAFHLYTIVDMKFQSINMKILTLNIKKYDIKHAIGHQQENMGKYEHQL